MKNLPPPTLQVNNIIYNLNANLRNANVLISACDCNIYGSNVTTCDNNGICSCKANIMNDKCDACDSGFHNFPICRDDSIGMSL